MSELVSGILKGDKRSISRAISVIDNNEAESLKIIHGIFKKTKNINYIKSHFDFYKKIDNNQDMLSNDVIIDAYKKVRSFYFDDVRNPIGIKNLSSLRNSGEAYLTPTIYTQAELISDLNIWYKRSI